MSASYRIADRFLIADLDRDRLGRGGMGDVYRATDAQSGETVAVKALNPDILARDPGLLERFLREGEALRRLNHPNIVRMVAACEENGRHYLVMEYVGGGSLEDLLKAQGRLPSARVLEIGLDLADALTRTHRLGILHRDLKPANVLLAADGAPRLADFGIAHVAPGPQLTQTGVLIGTVDYLSPEACQGEPLDERSDIWAFGVLLFEMLAGRLPFEGRSLTAVLTAILTQPLPDLQQLAPEVPEGLVDLVYRMLEKDRRQRIPSVRLVGAELEALLKGRQPVSPAPAARAESRFAAPTPGYAPRHNLPAQTTPFVGRQAELAELGRLLADPSVRLVTVSGLGGMGKTRLALEAGGAETGRFADGVFLVSLAPLQSAGAIGPTVAQALGFTFYEGGDPRRQLLDYLRPKELLLILDNCEHLLDGGSGTGELVEEILQTAPKVKILTTSRLRLGLQEERLFPLTGLDAPSEDATQDALQSGAVKLFVQAAQRVYPGFDLEPSRVQPVAHICRLVQGMPLAILLAASWVEVLAPTEIAAEMQSSLDFLQTEQPSVSIRQRSVRAVFDYSWGLLGESERQVFAALSVFRGGFTREAAQEVADASLRDLMRLTNKSLVHRTPAGRYEIHELLRQYAAEKLSRPPGEEGVAKDRHCRYYARVLHDRETLLFSGARVTAVSEIAVEAENSRMAWDWAVDHMRLPQMNHCLPSLAEFFRLRGWLREAHTAFARAADKLAAEHQDDAGRGAELLLWRLRAQQGRFSDCLGAVDDAHSLLSASVAGFRSLDSPLDTAYALCYLGGCEALYGSLHAEPCQEALDIFEQLEDRRGKALALRGLAWVALHQGDYPLARDRFQESLNAYRELGDPQGIAESLAGRGYIAWIMGDYRAGRRFHGEMLELCRASADRRGIARAQISLAQDALGLGLHDESLRLFEGSLAMYREMGDPWGIADVLGDMGEVANTMGRYEQAAEWAQQSLDTHGSKAERALEGWELRVIGDAACGMGDLRRARSYYRMALERDAGVWRPSRLLFTLLGVARLLTQKGQGERGLELLTFVLRHPSTWQWTKDRAAPMFDRLRAELPPDVVAAAEARGRARDLHATVEELLIELGS